MPTKDTNTYMLQIFDCLAIYPNNSITYRSSNMILAGHADAAYLNVSKSRSRAGAHIMLSEDVPIPLHNSPVLNIKKIIKKVMAYASEAEIAGLFTIANSLTVTLLSTMEQRFNTPQKLLAARRSATLEISA